MTDDDGNRDRHADLDRGVSTTLGYVLALAIAALLITGLLVAGGDFVEENRRLVINQELRVVGQQLGASVEMADRLVQAGGTGTTVRINKSVPAQVTGSEYRIEIVEESDPYLRLNSTDPAVSVDIEIENATALGASSANGGTVTITRDGGKLVIRNA